jgi:hypothetical protein
MEHARLYLGKIPIGFNLKTCLLEDVVMIRPGWVTYVNYSTRIVNRQEFCANPQSPRARKRLNNSNLFLLNEWGVGAKDYFRSLE